MRKVLSRWYVTLILLPILVNIFTNTISWENLEKNPCLVLLILSAALNITLIGEFFLFIKKTKTKKDRFESDKSIVKRLIFSLNLSANEEILKRESHAEKIDFNYVTNLQSFITQYEQLENRIVDNSTNKIFLDFANTLHKYLEMAKAYMVTSYENDLETISLPKDLKDKNYELYEKRYKELNDAATNCYNKLADLINFLRTRNYI